MAYKVTKKQIMDAVLASDGTYTFVMKKLKMSSSVTAKKYVHKYPDVLEAFREVQDGLIDLAEHTLINNLKSDNEFIRARSCEFVLKNMPQSRFKEVEGEDLQDKLVDLLSKMIDSAESKG